MEGGDLSRDTVEVHDLRGGGDVQGISIARKRMEEYTIIDDMQYTI